MIFGEGILFCDILCDSIKYCVSELLVNWWVQFFVICIFSFWGDMSMGIVVVGSNMMFLLFWNGMLLDLQVGLEVCVWENIILGVQVGYVYSVSGSSVEGYNGQVMLNVIF